MKFANSAFWSILQRYLPSLIHIIATLVITRLITPSDFGEVALVMTFNQISILIISSGLGEGLMYKVNNTQVLLSSVFYFNLAVSLILYSVFYLSSGFVSAFYGMPRLAILMKIVGLNIIVYALSYVQRIFIQMKLKFRTLAFISLFASIIGSVIGITLAYRGFNVWSIVLLTLSLNVVEMLLLWIKSSWKPVLSFSWKELFSILPYSLRIMINSFMQVIFDNLHSIIIGKSFGARPLGFFNRMQTVVYYTTTNFMYAIEMVFFPVLCKRKDDASQLMVSYEKLIRIATFLVFPVNIFLMAMSKPLIIAVLTEKWIEGVTVLMLISFAYLFVPIIYINNSYLKIINKTKPLLYTNMVKKIIGIIILFFTIHYGINIVCIGLIIYYLVDAMITMVCTAKYVGISLFKQISLLKNNVCLNICLFVLLLFIANLIKNPMLAIVIGGIVEISFVFGLTFIFKTIECQYLSEIIKGFVKR